jgi:hypothetical protein
LDQTYKKYKIWNVVKLTYLSCVGCINWYFIKLWISHHMYFMRTTTFYHMRRKNLDTWTFESGIVKWRPKRPFREKLL